MYQPARILVTDGGIFLDGGSIRIEVVDDLQVHYTLYLDRSFKAQDTHTTQLFVNQVAIPKASSEEDDWIQLLEQADYSSAEGILASLASSPLELDPADVADHLLQAETNPGWMSKYLTHQIILHLKSSAYHQGPTEMVIHMEEDQVG